MNTLTKRQREIYLALQDHFQNNDVAPSLDELCQQLGLASRGSLHKHIQALINEGLVLPLKGKQRGIQLVKSAHPDTLPLLGKIAAGSPIEALENPEPIQVPDHLRSKQNCFVLKIVGDSMINEGIYDGDWVVIEQTVVVKNGDIIVALIDNYEATLKSIQYKNSKIILHPANSDMQPMEYDANRVQIQGKLVGQMRSYH